MSFKMGLIAGLAAGYVLGAKAGRERYQQIVTWWNRFTGDPRVQQAKEKGKEIAGTAGRKGVDAVQTGVQKVGASVRSRLSHGEPNGFETGDMSL